MPWSQLFTSQGTVHTGAGNELCSRGHSDFLCTFTVHYSTFRYSSEWNRTWVEARYLLWPLLKLQLNPVMASQIPGTKHCFK